MISLAIRFALLLVTHVVFLQCESYSEKSKITQELAHHLQVLVHESLTSLDESARRHAQLKLTDLLKERRLNDRTVINDDSIEQSVYGYLSDFTTAHAHDAGVDDMKAVHDILDRQCKPLTTFYRARSMPDLSLDELLREAKPLDFFESTKSSRRAEDGAIYYVQLPGLNQLHTTGSLFYNRKRNNNWDYSCGFYATFHLSNFLQALDDDDLSNYFDYTRRSKFHTFLGMLSSAKDFASHFIDQLIEDKWYLNEREYCTLLYKKAVLEQASSIPLGFIFGHGDVLSLAHAWQFMTFDKIKYPVCYTNLESAGGFFYFTFSITDQKNRDISSLHYNHVKKVFESDCGFFVTALHVKRHVITYALIKHKDRTGRVRYFVFYTDSEEKLGNGICPDFFSAVRRLTHLIIPHGFYAQAHICTSNESLLRKLLREVTPSIKKMYHPKRIISWRVLSDGKIDHNNVENIIAACRINNKDFVAKHVLNKTESSLRFGGFIASEMLAESIMMHHFNTAFYIYTWMVENKLLPIVDPHRNCPPARVCEFVGYLGQHLPKDSTAEIKSFIMLNKDLLACTEELLGYGKESIFIDRGIKLLDEHY